MTAHQQILIVIHNAEVLATSACNKHAIAMQAFNVACARGDFHLAQREQDLAVEALSQYMDQIQVAQRHNLLLS